MENDIFSKDLGRKNKDSFDSKLKKNEELNDLNNNIEDILNDKVMQIEDYLKMNESSIQDTAGTESNRKNLNHNFYLSRIDGIYNLFLKARYLDEKSRNLIYDEIDDEIKALTSVILN